VEQKVVTIAHRPRQVALIREMVAVTEAPEVVAQTATNPEAGVAQAAILATAETELLATLGRPLRVKAVEAAVIKALTVWRQKLLSAAVA